MKQKRLGDLFARTLTGLCSCFLVFILVFFAQVDFFRPIFTAAVACIVSVALWEYYQLAKRKGSHPAKRLGITCAFVYVFATFISLYIEHSFWKNLPWIVLGASFFALFVYFAILKKNVLLDLAVSIFGLAYIVLPMTLFVPIVYFFLFREQPQWEGSFWLLYLIAVTKSADMGGYFIGRIFGRHKLAKLVSPNKTLEGAIGGLVASFLVSVIIVWSGKHFGYFASVSLLSATLLGLAIGVFGQMGDLAESLLKRDVGAKDSNSIPGVGGVLDMTDSLIFTAPLVYSFLTFHYG